MLANTLLLLLLQFPVEVVVVAVVLIAVVVAGGGGDNPNGFSGNSVSTRRSIINQAISFYYIYMTTNRKSIKKQKKSKCARKAQIEMNILLSFLPSHRKQLKT